MKTTKLILSLCTAVLLSTFVGVAIGNHLSIAPIYTVVGLLLTSLTIGSFIPKGTFGATLLTEIFTSDITAGLYPDNAFYKRSKDDSAWVNANKVNLPQMGASPNVVIDRTSLPATISKRTDTVIDYTLNEFTTDPILIQDSEELTVNYNKRQSVLADHLDKLNREIANNFLDIWFTNLPANIVRTTGANRAAAAPSATGNRKAVTLADITNVYNIMNRMDIPSEGRVMVIPATFLGDLLQISSFNAAQNFGSAILPSGVIGRIMGFDIYMRSIVGIYDATPVKKSLSAVGASTDNEAALFYHPQFVRSAKGLVKVFEKNDQPEYYGSIMSAMVRSGGVKARTDEKGIVALVEA